ncbi:MAG: AlpA family phage regulatory protein [Gracilimonas sp.]|uniref:helix-turn-helix transcriptional regulator n=1 Tax=Gracilimonas sp. TaxID=1974203 RepID=UPI0019BA1B25|nr:AlpA family phage regulatory protein [Gracilimonas sp.]MBD3616662.1 AlpA family phage regulatory protein [Gracilimonas sp.]
MNDLQIIRPNELTELLGVSRTTLHRMEKRGELPTRFKISDRAAGWLASDIREFLEEKAHGEQEELEPEEVAA